MPPLPVRLLNLCRGDEANSFLKFVKCRLAQTPKLLWNTWVQYVRRASGDTSAKGVVDVDETVEPVVFTGDQKHRAFFAVHDPQRFDKQHI